MPGGGTPARAGPQARARRGQRRRGGAQRSYLIIGWRDSAAGRAGGGGWGGSVAALALRSRPECHADSSCPQLRGCRLR